MKRLIGIVAAARSSSRRQRAQRTPSACATGPVEGLHDHGVRPYAGPRPPARRVLHVDPRRRTRTGRRTRTATAPGCGTAARRGGAFSSRASARR